jgi:folylpolyglutamate synthase/dihydropteroate synthase
LQLNIKEAIKEISPYVSEFICVDDFSSQAIPADELVDIIKAYNKSAFSVYDVRLAITEAKDYVKGNGMLLICGSLFLASVARKIILE